MSIELLAPQTDSGASAAFRLGPKDKVTITNRPLLQAAEECHLQMSVNGGVTWLQVVADILDGDTTTHIYTLDTPGYFRVFKDATAVATGVYLEGRARFDGV